MLIKFNTSTCTKEFPFISVVVDHIVYVVVVFDVVFVFVVVQIMSYTQLKLWLGLYVKYDKFNTSDNFLV